MKQQTKHHIGAFIFSMIIIILLLFSSCSPTKRISNICKKHPEVCQADTIESTDTTFMERIVPIEIPPDSSWLDAYFKCDSLGQVRMEMIEKLLGERSDIRVERIYIPSVQDSGFRFTANCDAWQDSIAVKDMIISKLRQINTVIPCDDCLLRDKWYNKILIGFLVIVLILLILDKVIRLIIKRFRE